MNCPSVIREEYSSVWFVKSVLLLALLLTSGCTHFCEEGSYLHNRGKDFSESFHIASSVITDGAMLNVGPLIVGGQSYDPKYAGRLMLGPGGMVDSNIQGDAVNSGVIWPLSSAERIDYTSDYKRRDIGWASCGFDIGFLMTLGVRIDLVEFLDCLGGIFALDLLSDDLKRYESEEMQHLIGKSREVIREQLGSPVRIGPFFKSASGREGLIVHYHGIEIEYRKGICRKVSKAGE